MRDLICDVVCNSALSCDTGKIGGRFSYNQIELKMYWTLFWHALLRYIDYSGQRLSYFLGH